MDLSGRQVSQKLEKPIAMAYRISVVKMEELMQQQIKFNFPERQHEERLEMSQEDHMFMESVSKSVKLVDGDTIFPNNRLVSEQRAINLKRKLSRNNKFHEDYKMFMANIFGQRLCCSCVT